MKEGFNFIFLIFDVDKGDMAFDQLIQRVLDFNVNKLTCLAGWVSIFLYENVNQKQYYVM